MHLPSQAAARSLRFFRALFAGAVALPILIVALAGIDSRQQALDEAAKETEQIVGMLHEHALKVFETHALVLTQVGSLIAGLGWPEIEQDERLRRALTTATAHSEQIKGVWLADATGRVRASSRPVPRPIDISDRDFFRAQRENDAGTYISEPFIGRVAGTPAFAASRRRSTAAGEFDGIVQISVDHGYFVRFWQSVAPLNRDAAVALTRSDGVMLARYPPAPGGETIRLGPGAPLMQAILHAEQGTDTWLSPIGGGARIVSYRKLAGYPVYISFGVGSEAVLAEWSGEIVHFAAAALVLIAALGLIGWLGLRRARAHADAESQVLEAEARLRGILESTTECVYLVDRDWRIVYLNERANQVLSRGRKLLGANLWEIAPAAVNGPLWRAYHTAMDERVSTTVETFYEPFGGWFEARAHPSGLGIAIFFRDVTGQRKAAEALRRSEDHSARAQRAAAIGTWEWHLGMNGAVWSDETYRLYGVSRETFVPRRENIHELIVPEDLAATRRIGDMVAAGLLPTPADFANDHRVILPDGSIRVLHREGNAVHDSEGRAVGLIGTVQDVTATREAERRRRGLEAQLLQAQRMESLGTLAGGIAHDLNNALLPILMLTKLVAGTLPADSRERGHLDVVQQAGQRAQNLVRQILAFSRKEDARKELLFPAALVRNSLSMLRASLQPMIRLDSTIEDVPAIMADPGQLQQVLVNLVTNAGQAIGDRPGTIEVALSCSGAAVRLSVRDTGCGMDERTLARIFEPFFTTKPVNEGTGLGLSVVHGIVANHGGRVDVQSVLGEGTIFTVELPVAAASELDAEGGPPNK